MASIHIARFVDINFMFNIRNGVGKGRMNDRLDVLLVQYLLKHATQETAVEFGTSQSRIIPPEYKGENIRVDGMCGPKTLRYIEYYQMFRNSHAQHSGGNEMPMAVRIKCDGAVDPWKYPLAMNFRHKNNEPIGSTYTLACLSYDAAKSHEIRTQMFDTMPIELQRVLLAR